MGGTLFQGIITAFSWDNYETQEKPVSARIRTVNLSVKSQAI
jgi:hypothetical protein